MLTPQTMAVITRIFPSDRRGQAMALWGATAGVATLVGPILGGILVDALGWEWIFFINIPVGVLGFVLAVRWCPGSPTHTHKFDWLGVALSGLGMFLLVFGIQQGHKYHWNAWVMASIIGGVLVFLVFVLWQRRNTAEPLVPAEPVQRPQLLDLQLRDLHDVVHGDRDGLPDDALRPAGARILTPAVRAAVRTRWP